MILNFWIRPLALKLNLVSATNSWLDSFKPSLLSRLAKYLSPPHHSTQSSTLHLVWGRMYEYAKFLLCFLNKVKSTCLLQSDLAFLPLCSCIFSAQNWASKIFYCVCQRNIYRTAASFHEKQICQKKLFLKLHQYWDVRKTSFFLKSTTNSICFIATLFYEFFSPSGHFSICLLFCHFPTGHLSSDNIKW